MLNTRGGRIFVGVDDDGKIVGVPSDRLTEYANRISNACSDSVEPPCEVRTANVASGDELVIVITIPDGPDKPYQTKDGHFWVKKGADKRRVTNRTELQRMFQAAHVVYGEIKPVSGSSLGDIDRVEYAEFHRRRFGSPPPIEEPEQVRELEAMKLAEGNPKSGAVAQ